jgi:hypothetical protein
MDVKDLKTVLEEISFDKESDIQAFPDGKTELEISKCTTKEVPVSYNDGTQGTKHIINYQDKKYWAGKQVMAGLKEAVENGKDKVFVLKKGQGLKTNYIVMEVDL